VLVLAAAVVTTRAILATRAHAQTAPDKVAASQALFDQARHLMVLGQYSEACPKLEESQRLDPGGGTLLNLADCYEHLGQLDTAWRKFIEAATTSRNAGNLDRERVARERADALFAKIPKIVIRVPAAIGGTPGFEIRRDGELVAREQWGSAVPVGLGEHAVAAAAPGYRSWRSTVTVSGNATATIAVPELERETAAVSARDAAPRDVAASAASEPSASIGAQRVMALAAGTVGVAGIAVGTVFGLRKIAKHSEADDACNGGPACPSENGVKIGEEATKAGNISTAAFAIGAVGLAAGAVLWFTATPNRSAAYIGIGVGTIEVGGRL
jgi:hypothetical protein